MSDQPAEIILHCRAFVPEAIAPDVVVRRCNCDLVAEYREGHTMEQCVRALRLEVGRLRLSIVSQQVPEQPTTPSAELTVLAER